MYYANLNVGNNVPKIRKYLKNLCYMKIEKLNKNEILYINLYY